MSDTVKCPYCEDYVNIDNCDHYDGYEEYECPRCSKIFEVYAEPSIHYSACGKADCLNGAEHKWKKQIGFPEIAFKGKYICEDCSATKEVKEELATKPEWDEYFNDKELK